MNILYLKIITNDNSDIEVQIHIDTSDFIIRAILLQKKNRYFHLIAYYSYWLNTSQLNYTVHEKETLAIISSLDQWSQYL